LKAIAELKGIRRRLVVFQGDRPSTSRAGAEPCMRVFEPGVRRTVKAQVVMQGLSAPENGPSDLR